MPISTVESQSVTCAHARFEKKGPPPVRSGGERTTIDCGDIKANTDMRGPGRCCRLKVVKGLVCPAIMKSICSLIPGIRQAFVSNRIFRKKAVFNDIYPVTSKLSNYASGYQCRCHRVEKKRRGKKRLKCC